MKADPARPRHANCSRARDDSNVRPLPLELSRNSKRAIEGPLPLGGVSFIEGLRAPVAQLDRALPSEAGVFLSVALIKHPIGSRAGGFNDSPFCTKRHVSGTNLAPNCLLMLEAKWRPRIVDVRCYSNSGQTRARLDCPLCANSGHPAIH